MRIWTRFFCVCVCLCFNAFITLDVKLIVFFYGTELFHLFCLIDRIVSLANFKLSPISPPVCWNEVQKNKCLCFSTSHQVLLSPTVTIGLFKVSILNRPAFCSNSALCFYLAQSPRVNYRISLIHSLFLKNKNNQKKKPVKLYLVLFYSNLI